MGSMVAVIPTRDGVFPAGAADAVAEAEGRAVGIEWTGGAAAVAASVAPHVQWAHVVVLPASPDGRDLAPHLARLLGRPLLAGAVVVNDRGASVARFGGRVIDDVALAEPFVATLEPGARDTEPFEVETLVHQGAVTDAPAATTIAVLPPDPSTVDLAEARRIVGGGAGLDGPDRFHRLGEVANAIGASLGATRVVTDRGWIGHERQIGTTGMLVSPDLYLAFGVSGAVQHTGGLGTPEHVISVNTDPHCPMMQLADLAIVSDANEVVDELARRLGVSS